MHKAILFFILLTSPLFGQNEFYVSPAGNNASAGTLLQPWQTAQYALDHAVPGCTIYLMGGTYRENLDFTVSGTSSDHITLTSYAGQSAVIDGTGTSGDYLLRISGKNYINVEHLEFANLSKNNACGILIEGNSTSVNINNNRIHKINFSFDPVAPVQQGRSAHAIAVYGNNPVQQITSIGISHNTIFSCRTGKSPAVEISGNVGLFGISRNKISDISNSGIGITSYKGTSSDVMNDRPENGQIWMNTIHDCLSETENASGILVDGAMFCRIENNSLYSNTIGITICCSAVGKSAISVGCRNNVVYRNHGAGIFLGGFVYPAGCGAVEGCSVYCNTLFENNSSGTGAELLIGYTSNTTVKSNIVDGHSNTVLVKCTEPGNLLSMNFNLYYCQSIPEFSWNGNATFSFAGWQTISGGDANSLLTNPQFVSPSDANVHLEMSSPAIDRGDSTYLPVLNEVDMDTMTRVQNGRVDIGADEYGTTVGITETNPNHPSTMSYYESGSDMVFTFLIPQSVNTKVFLYDATGKTLGVAEAKKGDSSVKFSNAAVASGVYFVSANGFVLKIVR
ncbi:MAG: hypothetical protein M3R17_06665 [Bacteroidota bacterium]|nr:hypothetical protein [Bacteroidota bacterium]